MPGVDIHAEFWSMCFQARGSHGPIMRPGSKLYCWFSAAGIMALLARFAKPVAAVAVLLLALEALAFASFYAFSRQGLLFDALMPGATWGLTYATMTVAVYRRSERQRAFVRKAFGRYLAPALVERLAKRPEQTRTRRRGARCFSPVRRRARFHRPLGGALGRRGRTIPEPHPDPLTQSVLVEAGTIDKYFGDGLMAFWNAPLAVTNHAERACAAALAMRDALPALNAHLVQTGIEARPIDIGIGINTGEAFVGNMGSDCASIIRSSANRECRLASRGSDEGARRCDRRRGNHLRAAPGFASCRSAKPCCAGAATRRRSTPCRACRGRSPGFFAFLQLHDAALQAVAAAAPDASGKIRAARDASLWGGLCAFLCPAEPEFAAVLPRAV